jgi:hypothetical protein
LGFSEGRFQGAHMLIVLFAAFEFMDSKRYSFVIVARFDHALGAAATSGQNKCAKQQGGKKDAGGHGISLLMCWSFASCMNFAASWGNWVIPDF